MHTPINDDNVDHNYLLSVLEKTRQKLLDHTRRNRLLNYKETGRDIAIIDEMANLLYEDLVVNSNRFYFDCFDEDDQGAEEDDLFTNNEPTRILPRSQTSRSNVDERYRDDRLQTPFSEKELERRLRRLYSEHRTLVAETGANSLFIAMGFLEWSDSEDEPRPMRSPLVLVPVRLHREGTVGQAQYSLTFDDGALDSNYSLIEKIKNNFDLNLPNLKEEEKPEDYWERVSAAIVRRQEAGWNVVHEMALGLFKLEEALERFWSQNIQPLYPDRARSILSVKMIAILVQKRPTNKEDWFNMIPTDLRQSIHPDEGEFRQDVFEIIDEYEVI